MHGEYKMPGGKLVVIDLDLHDCQLANVQLSGDFFLEPDSALHTINAALTGQPVDADEATLVTTLRVALSSEVMMYGVSPEAIAVAVRRALQPGSDA
jgi:lipoate-protein ligase A